MKLLVIKHRIDVHGIRKAKYVRIIHVKPIKHYLIAAHIFTLGIIRNIMCAH